MPEKWGKKNLRRVTDSHHIFGESSQACNCEKWTKMQKNASLLSKNILPKQKSEFGNWQFGSPAPFQVLTEYRQRVVSCNLC